MGHSAPVGAWLLGPGNWESEASPLSVTVLLGLDGCSGPGVCTCRQGTGNPFSCFFAAAANASRGSLLLSHLSGLVVDGALSWTGWKTSASHVLSLAKNTMKLDLGLPLVS